MVTLLQHYYPSVVTCEQYSEDSLENVLETCGQRSGYWWTRELRLADKISETCGQDSVTCVQENGDLWTRERKLAEIEWRLVDKRVKTCGQQNGDF